MRGKHQRAKASRASAALRDEIDQLQAEIERDQQRLVQAQNRAEQAHLAKRRLEQERVVTQRRLRPVAEEAARRAAGARRVRGILADARREIRDADAALHPFGATAETVEQIGQAGVPLRLAEVHSKASREYQRIWFRKQSGHDLTGTRYLSLEGWMPDGFENSGKEVHGRFMHSLPLDEHPEACWTWAIPPWLRIPSDFSDAPTLRAQLGATTTGAPRLPPAPFPGPAPRRDAVFTAPWRHAPMVPHPADAIDLGYWYHRSTWAQGWRPDTTPVPMWLPPEHSTAFPSAKPLPSEVELRLPFPVVFAALSEPWRIEPSNEDTHPFLAAHPLLMHARGRLGEDRVPPAAEDTLHRLQSTGLADRDDLPSPLETLHGYGGYIEGLLLSATENGVPADDFCWCAVIYHPLGLPLARVAIPASRARARWRHQIDNIIAGIALSCWHEATTLPARSNGQHPLERIGAATDPDGLHVLDIDATSPPRPDTSDGSGPSRRPHLRRGHWRDQPVGTGRTQRRWTWVRSSAIHGGSATANQMYTLRE